MKRGLEKFFLITLGILKDNVDLVEITVIRGFNDFNYINNINMVKSS